MQYAIRAMAESIAVRLACVACGARSGNSALCASCEAVLRRAEGCPRCGSIECRQESIFGSCATSWLPFRSCTAALEYSSPASDVVVALKRSGSYRCARLLARCLGKVLPPEAAAASIVTWVPSSSWAAKGFDHGAILARAVASLLGVRALRMLHRKEGIELKRMGRQGRLNAASDFLTPTSEAIASSVLVVDDVTTTGASLYCAALELKKAGFRDVHVAAVARTPLRSRFPAKEEIGAPTRFSSQVYAPK